MATVSAARAASAVSATRASGTVWATRASSTGAGAGAAAKARRISRAPRGSTPMQVAATAVSTRATPPVESAPAVTTPSPVNAPTHSVVPSADQSRKRPNGIRATPAAIGTTAWITATKRIATSAGPPWSRRYASARAQRSAPIRRPRRVSRNLAPRTRPTA